MEANQGSIPSLLVTALRRSLSVLAGLHSDRHAVKNLRNKNLSGTERQFDEDRFIDVSRAQPRRVTEPNADSTNIGGEREAD